MLRKRGKLVVIIKGEDEEKKQQLNALQGTGNLTAWAGDNSGWNSFKAAAEKIRAIYPDALEQVSKVKALMLNNEHKAYIDSFKHTSDPIMRLIELLTPRYGSSQFLMSELEDHFEKIPDAK